MMIRFFLKTTTVRCGVTRFIYSSIDGDVKELERALTSGGYGEDACEFTELVGCEVMEARNGLG